MAHEMPCKSGKLYWLTPVILAVHQTALAHGQEAIFPAALILIESIAALIVAVFVAIFEADRLHRAAPGGRGLLRGLAWMFAALGSWFVMSLTAGALYTVVFKPEGMYPVSVPFGFTVGTAVLVLWYLKRRRNARAEGNAP